MTPLVSICIPAFNGSRWISDCIASALSQCYNSFEVLIVDDASTDSTVEQARSFADSHVRVVVNERNLGLPDNWNKCVNLAEGEFIKFLFQDDLLYPNCLENMMHLFLANASLGLVFAPRDVIVERGLPEEFTGAWLRDCRTLHTKFDGLGQTNPGRALFLQHMRKGFKGNWVGEPSSVMFKKDCLRRVGAFNAGLRQVCDIEMWLRIMYFYDVGFLSEKLSAFRLHAGSASAANFYRRQNRLEHLRLLDGLMANEQIRAYHTEIVKLRHVELITIALRLTIPSPIRRKIRALLKREGARTWDPPGW
jgi:glycosyltransferase involved in cell wall biosynthesis